MFPVAVEHNVGIVGMKLFCWDCGPSNWDKRISVFEPVMQENPVEDNLRLSPAQRHLLWCIRNSPCDVVVPAMNTMREAEENIRALSSIDINVGTDGFENYGGRLWDRAEIRKVALYAESKTIRERAGLILKPRRWVNNIYVRTLKAHYRILKEEGLKKYILRSYYYRKEQLLGGNGNART